MRREMPTGLLAIVLGAVLAAASLSACGSGSEEGSAQYSDSTDSPLLEFGEEGSEEELEQADAAVEGFFVARAKGDFDSACARLAKPILDRFERLAANSTGLRDTSCASFLATFLSLTPEERRESVVVDGGSLRHKGNSGYLIYSGYGDEVFVTSLRKEDGEWKLANASSEALS